MTQYRPNKDDTNLVLSFALPIDHAHSFPNIRVARKCTYDSISGSVSLHITEIQDLRVERVGITEDGEVVYRACAKGSGREQGKHQECRWFEVEISGKAWKKFLGQDENIGEDGEMEVGTERNWLVEDWRESVEEVVRVAGEMVIGMGGVGGWNENPFGALLRAEEKKKEEKKNREKMEESGRWY